jgi:hypothetical protein
MADQTVLGISPHSEERPQAKMRCRTSLHLRQMPRSFNSENFDGYSLLWKKLAEHASKCRGGTVEHMKYRQPAIEANIKAVLSAHLASSLAERLGAYVSGAVRRGRHASPVSTLLTSEGF